LATSVIDHLGYHLFLALEKKMKIAAFADSRQRAERLSSWKRTEHGDSAGGSYTAKDNQAKNQLPLEQTFRDREEQSGWTWKGTPR
jgi:hypothetical protein